VIHIESVRFECNLTYALTVSGADSTNVDFNRTVPFNSQIGVGFGISVRSIGNYSITYKYNSTDAASYGSLARDGLTVFAALDHNDTFYTNVEVIAAASRCDPLPTNSFSRSSVFTHSGRFGSGVVSESLSSLDLYTQESLAPHPGTKDKDEGHAVIIGAVTGTVLVVAILVGTVFLLRPSRQSAHSDDDQYFEEQQSETMTMQNQLVFDDDLADYEFGSLIDSRRTTAVENSLEDPQSAAGAPFL
jgi:hypothetical protein